MSDALNDGRPVFELTCSEWDFARRYVYVEVRNVEEGLDMLSKLSVELPKNDSGRVALDRHVLRFYPKRDGVEWFQWEMMD